MKKIVLGTVIAAASLMAANFAPCASCHGAKAEKAALGKSQIIAGWDEAKTIAALKGYKDGSYGGAMKGVMKGQVARLSDADIADLAKQIAAFK
ncbi:c-type cytochrome [Malaciobacter mytili]|uniref:Cytochrome C n=1 Tax=Malaciobacter mytili LMG 24559 TaxID=1032238 RepID=A0AAX2AEH7_9BACT|nr:c-type cytochrome [Malaciobacter mytili]AXH14235.1 periplasmic monoheme cytochrome c553 [Malaciobacter mytili LMG 24559]RXI48768.1 cytochrome C [Malaciobacter mytili]RXK15323.1 cytochrome C [Malaciobacter mytili LMG 24559]